VYGASRRATPEMPVHSLHVDVSCDESVKQAVDEIMRREARIDLLVNNAGFGLAGPVEEISIEQVRRQMEVNFFGVLRLCQAVLPIMREQRSGAIINVSSLAGVFGLPFQALYSASKFAVEGLTEALRYEVRPFGIRVVLVEPGDVRTEFTARRVKASANSMDYKATFEAALRKINCEEDWGANPEGVAELVCRIYLSQSPRLRYTVGHGSQRAAAWAKLPPGRSGCFPALCSRKLLSAISE
jgi:NAD(P)-dependent dehydrogenase (short-subunit alcohol dehydrogenase family)